MKKIPRILLAAVSSNSGKTAAACGMMSAYVQQGLNIRSCKCGPDYIDPMFHREVLGVDSENLDLFFSDAEELTKNFIRHTEGADLVIAEGVSGYFSCECTWSGNDAGGSTERNDGICTGKQDLRSHFKSDIRYALSKTEADAGTDFTEDEPQ